MLLTDLFEDLDLDDTALRAIVEHISFPPKLPQAALDRPSAAVSESAICALTAATARNYAGECASEQRPVWTRLANAIDQLGRNVAVPLHKAAVFDGIRNMKELGMPYLPFKALLCTNLLIRHHGFAHS